MRHPHANRRHTVRSLGSLIHSQAWMVEGLENRLLLTAAIVPINDDFANRTEITDISSPITGNNELATREYSEPLRASYGQHSVWWTWTAPTSGTVSIETAGSSFATFVAVYTGNSLSALHTVWELPGTRFFGVTSGTTYQISLDGWNGAAGDFSLAIAYIPPPANDNFANRIRITDISAPITGSNVAATREWNEPYHAGYPGGHSVWWTWTAPTAGMVRLSPGGSAIDTLLAVYTGDSLGGGGGLACVGAASRGIVLFHASAGTHYQIAFDNWDGWYSRVGDFSLTLSYLSPPPNDNFASRTEITGISASVTGSNLLATKEAGERDPAWNPGGSSVWWTWTAPLSGTVQINTSGSSFDTVLAVYKGNDLPGLIEVAVNDDANIETPISSVQFATTAGTAYQIVVDGYGGDIGDIALNIQMSDVAVHIAPGAGDDTITVTLDGGDYVANVNGSETRYPASSIGSLRIDGGDGDDVITIGPGVMACTIDGGLSNDSITAGEGNDSIRGDGGNDTIYGGAGNDSIMGNSGDDLISGDDGNDIIRGGLGADAIWGGRGDDSLYGGAEADLISGQDGDDYIEGKGKRDTILGGAGNDTIYGGAGSDLICGDEGDDWIDVGVSTVFHDTVYGGTGIDSVRHDADDFVYEAENILA